jgi:hypothetical protein
MMGRLQPRHRDVTGLFHCDSHRTDVVVAITARAEERPAALGASGPRSSSARGGSGGCAPGRRAHSTALARRPQCLISHWCVVGFPRFCMLIHDIGGRACLGRCGSRR